MPIIRLTHRIIPTLRAGAWMTDYWDDILPGFGVRVSQSGHKTFVARFNDNGSKRRVTLGTFPELGLADARVKAREELAEAMRCAETSHSIRLLRRGRSRQPLLRSAQDHAY